MGAERNTQSFSEIRKMNVSDLILLDFMQLKQMAERLIEDKNKDEGATFLAFARKSIRAKDIAVIDTLKKHSLLKQEIFNHTSEERMLLDEIDRLTFFFKEGRLNLGEKKKSLNQIARKIITYIDRERKRIQILPEILTGEVLSEMGTAFLEMRNFTDSELFPEDEISWKDEIQKVSSRTLNPPSDLHQ